MNDLNLSWTPSFGQIYTWIAMDKFGHLAFMVNNNWGNIPKVILQKENPEKEFIPAPPEDSTCACNDCSYMKMNTLEKLYLCLKNERPEIFVDEEVRLKAVKPIERMLEISAKHGL